MAEAPSKNPKKRLFEDDEDDDDDNEPAVPSGSASKVFGKESSFTINEEFARRFEHNKKREERQRLEEKYGKGKEDAEDSESSDDETEDEGGYLLTEELDARMSAALEAIKNKDPRIYDSETKFFDPSEIDQIAQDAQGSQDAQAASSKDAKQKPVFLRDYHRERYLRGDVGEEDEDDDEDDEDGGAGASVPKTYQQEQDEIKRKLVAEMNADDSDTKMGGADGDDDDNDDDDDDDIDSFMKPKASTKASKEAAEAAGGGLHPARAQRVRVTELDVAHADENPDLFLSNFLASRAWVPEDEDEGKPRWQAFESDDEDDADRDRVEAFETAYNMRFEDPDKSNEVLKSYSRTVVAERSVRRDAKTARQRQREAEKEAAAAAKQTRKEEKARLRKLRIEETQAKLAQIKQAAGLRGRRLAEDEWATLLDGAWDNDTWEAEMQKRFGDDYYAEPDAGVEVDNASGDEDGDDGHAKKAKKPKKPKWDDDIDIKDIVTDFDDGDAKPNVTLSDSEGEADAQAEEDEEAEDGEKPAKRRKTAKDRKKERVEAKHQARNERARIEALVDQQLAMEGASNGEGSSRGGAAGAAGTSGSAGASFRYRETSPQTFGLTTRDILLAPSDAALNEFVGLKKLATFRDAERKRKDRKKLGKKARLRQWRKDTFGAEFEHSGPTYGFERLVGVPAAGGEEQPQDETEKAHGKKKRKRSGRKGKGKAEA